jgi:hypothetical protein
MVQAKILIGMFQITVELPDTLNLNYPEPFALLLRAVRVLIMDVFAIVKIECVTPLSVHSKFILVMLLPVASVGLLQLVRRVSDWKIARGDLAGVAKDRQRDENRTTAAYRTYFIIFLFYPLLSRTVFRMFACQELHHDKSTLVTESWHVDDYSIDCNGPTHGIYKVVAGVFIFIYPIGIPLVFLLLLWKDKKRRTQSRPELGKSSSVDFLRRDYRDDYYYFEVVTLMEKLLLTGILVFIKRGTIFQAFTGGCIAVVFLGVHCWVWPYKEQTDNALKTFAEGQLFLTLFISVILRTQLEREPLEFDDYGMILSVVFCVTPTMEIICLVWLMCTAVDGEKSEGEEDGLQPEPPAQP